MPTKTWAVGEEVLAADFNSYVQRQVVATFPNAAARTAAIAAPVGGQVTYRDDVKVVEFWNGTVWAPVQPVYGSADGLGAARIRAGTIVVTTDASGIASIPLSPPLGTPVSWSAVLGDNLPAVIFKPLASGWVAGATAPSVVAVRTTTDAPLTSTATRINYLVVDRLT